MRGAMQGMGEPDLTGRVLGGRYTLRKRLGAGGWGAVYAAVQNDLGRPVAVKVLHVNVAITTDGLARFEREAKSAAALGHPNIAQVTDFQAALGEPPFLVMELLEGATLGEVLRREHKLPPARVAWIAHQILAGLDVAHRAGIVHRDIKPDNVFLVSMPGVEDHVKLLDFGIAKLSGESQEQQLTATGATLGSPAFMAPEQIRTRSVDHRVDLYAVGATMYLALSGRMPFEADTVHGMLLAVTEQRAVPLAALEPSIDPRLAAVIERAMHKDPAGRFGSAAEMRAALEPWLGARAGQAAGIGPDRQGRSPSGPPMISPASIATAGPPGSAMAATGYGPPPHMTSGPPAAAAYAGPPAGGFGAPPGPGAHGSSPPAPVVPAYGLTPAPEPVKGSRAVVVLLVAIVGLLVLLLAGGAVGFWLYASRAESAATPAASAPAMASGAPASSGAAPSASGAAASPGSTTTVAAATAVKAGARPPTGGPAAAGAVAPGAPAVAIIDAGVPVAPAAPAAAPDAGARKQFAGSTNWRLSGGTFNQFEIEPAKAAIMKMSGPITACYVATEFDPPDHQFTDWTFQIAPAGNVLSVRRTTDFQPHPKLDACLIAAFRQVRFAATPTGGPMQLSFSARTRDNP